MSNYILDKDGKLYTVDANSDELMHYGVIGMKWGVRRANKKGIDYAYKSHATKKI